MIDEHLCRFLRFRIENVATFEDWFI